MTTTEIIALTNMISSKFPSLFWRASGQWSRHDAEDTSSKITSSPLASIDPDAACYFCLDGGSDYKQSPRKVHHDITKKIRKEMDDLVTKGLLHALLITGLT